MVGVTSWLEISRERLEHNFSALLRIAGNESPSDSELDKAEPVALLAVVKANAYGHGVDPCAAILAEAGAEWLGVTDAREGAAVCDALAAAGIAESERPQILVMCGTAALAGEAERMVKHGLVPVVWSAGHVARLAAAAEEAGLSDPVRVHVEVDTGMSRQGVVGGEELDVLLETIRDEPRVELDGLLTHFASTEVAHSEQTVAQQEQFEQAVEQLAAAGMRPRWVHVGNSSYIDNGAEGSPMLWLRSLAERISARSMVRSGLALYGYLLPIEGGGRSLAAAEVLPVMTWKTQVIGISNVSPGTAVGYNGSYVAEWPMRLALLPVGYADGFRRELSSPNQKSAVPGGWVMIRGERAAVVGRVSMNLITVDVSGIEGVCEGDEAVLLGDGITADHHARLAGTITYEILCGVRASCSR